MTTLVKASWFGAIDTDEQAQLIANNMAVTPEYFAEVSCEGDRLFGVVTRCRRETCQETCETVLNECARKNLWQYAYMVQQELEATLGWTLSPRYVTETLPWDGKSRVRLTFGGLEELFKTEVATTVASDVVYNPYVYQATTVATLGTHTEVLIPFTYLSKPEGVMFRNPNTGKVFEYNVITGYPEIRIVGPDKFWVLGIHGGNANVGDTLDVLDCLYGYVEMPEVECEGDVALTYPDSVQKIPIEKIVGDRWYIKHRHMVRQEYQGDEIDLTQFQIHKLYDLVDVVCYTEGCSLITIRKKCIGLDACGCDDDETPCTIVEADGCATIINAQSGIIDIHEIEIILDDNDDPVLDDEGCPTFRQKEDCTDCLYTPYEIVVSYKTNPVKSGLSNSSSVETLRQSIAARVAAEVNLVDCGCNVECGFFKEMRKEMNTTIFNDRSTIVSLKYGNKVGQLKYAQTLETAVRNQKVGML